MTLQSDLIYLDHASATPVEAGCLQLQLALGRDHFANPSAGHQLGRAARDCFDQTRARLARLWSVRPDQLIYTAGATEANNLILAGLKAAGLKTACLVSDHVSILAGADYQLDIEPQTGYLDLAGLKLPAEVGLVSLAAVNSETGVCQPLSLIGQALAQIRARRQAQDRPRPLYWHLDASQWLIWQPRPPIQPGVDLITVSGAKIGAPKQTGLIYKDPDFNLTSTWAGGGQEQGWRPGTESVANFGALAWAADRARQRAVSLAKSWSELKQVFESGLKSLGAEIILAGSKRSPQISACLFRGYDNERLVFGLGRANIMVGLGSACGGRTGHDPTVLTSLGYRPDEIRASLRFSFGRQTSLGQLERTLAVLKQLLADPVNRLS